MVAGNHCCPDACLFAEFDCLKNFLAGSLYAHYLSFISPKTFDIFYSIQIVTMVVVGGIGNLVITSYSIHYTKLYDKGLSNNSYRSPGE